MAKPEAVTTMGQILQWRREFSAQNREKSLFTDVDYIVCNVLVSLLKIKRLRIDNAAIVALFRDNKLESELEITGPGEPTAEVRDQAIDEFSELFILSAACGLDSKLLEGIDARGSLAICYGISGQIGNEFIHTLNCLLASGEEGVLLPLFGIAPGLWRATSLLVFRRSRWALVIEALRELTAAFSCDDLDALRLLEENMQLRTQVQKLIVPGTAAAEIQTLKSTIASLQSEILSLRRVALYQEQTIAAAQSRT
jgi:hypothetical protein